MSLKRKLAGNGIASAGSIFWTSLLQVVSVPVLVHAWGLERYGVWLMISTIPSYLALSDLGFASAATSDMTIAFARGERTNVVTTFQSVWVLALGIGAISVLAALPLMWVDASVNEGVAWWRVHATTLFLMVTYSATALVSRVVLGALRSTGHYASGTILYDFVQALEGIALLAVAIGGGGFAMGALAHLVFRIVNIGAMIVLLRLTEPWLEIGAKSAVLSELKRLVAPALGAMAIPTALSLNIQGMVLVAGGIVSPAAVAVLGPVRTVSRVAIQLVGIINRATMPEFSAAAARDDRGALRKLVRLNIYSVLVLLLPGAVVFAVFGSSLVSLWTGGVIVPSRSFVALMALAMFLHGSWFFASNLLLAVNSHVSLSTVAAIAALVGIVVAIPLASGLGLEGIAVAVAGSEMVGVLFLCLFIRNLRRRFGPLKPA